MKTCAFCAETDLQDAAKVCKHCGREQKEEWWVTLGLKNEPLKSKWQPIISLALMLLLCAAGWALLKHFMVIPQSDTAVPIASPSDGVTHHP